MRKSLKIAALAAVLLLVLGAAVLVYGNSNGSNANDDEQEMNMRNMETFFESNNCTVRCRMRHMERLRGNGFQWFERLSENATLSTVQGEVVSVVKGMLILDTGAGQVRVLLPKEWSVNDEVLGRFELFNGTFADQGQNVTVKVLESDVFSNANFSINIMIGYEAINATGTHAYAVLPFNIQPNS